MIHQCYFDASQTGRLFPTPAYRGFGLYSSVNPEIAVNCPELADPAMQAKLSEYAAMLHQWRNPRLDDDSWIGFTSYRQVDKFPTVFRDKKQVEDLLAQNDIVGWGCYAFVDGQSQVPMSMADSSEMLHPGMTACIWRLMSLQGQTVPIGYLTGRSGLFCNYWAMSKSNFNEYMNWSYPLVRSCLDKPDAYVQSHPRSLAYLVERLFICWYLTTQKVAYNAGPVVTLGVFGQPPAEAPKDQGFITLPSWNMTLDELCRHHRLRPRGIIHVGAHWAEEREAYRRLAASNVLWIEADPNNMPQLRANIADYAGHKAIEACLAEEEGRAVPFFRTNNRGESSSILPMGVHRQMYPEIQVVEETSLRTTTFVKLAEREKLDIDAYDLLVVDVQGAELLALRGFGDDLSRFIGIYLEVNLDYLYQGCPLLADVDEFLGKHGFERREALITDKRYGDALYIRKSVAAPPSARLAQLCDQLFKQLLLTRSYTFHLMGSGSQQMELLEHGRIGSGSGPHHQRWQVRPCGFDSLLEITGQFGRTHVLRLCADGIWRGSTPLNVNLLVQLIPGGLASRLKPAGFPANTNLPLELVERLAKNLAIKHFVETGTHKGVTTRLAASRFEKVSTIEVDPDLFRQTSTQLADCPNVNCLQGSSATLLPKILEDIHGPVLFWLDAHWCDVNLSKSGSECPLLDELATILAHRQDHVVMIDDARLFLSPPPPPHDASHWPSYIQICELAARQRPMPCIQLVGDVIVLGPPAIAEDVAREGQRTIGVPEGLEPAIGWE